MATVPHIASGASNAIGAGATSFSWMGIATAIFNLVESNRKTRWNDAGTFSLLTINLLTNDRTGAGTFRTRKNGANATQTISLTAATTGFFQDGSNTDTVSSGEDWNVTIIGGTGGTTCTVRQYGFAFAASTNTRTKYVLNTAINFNGSTVFTPPFTGPTPNISGTETAQKHKFHGAGTLRNLTWNITTNTKGATGTLRSRVNEANGNQSISLTAGTTGIVQDTSNTDTIAAGDFANHQWAPGDAAGGIAFLYAAMTFETTDASSTWIVQEDQGLTSGLTRYFTIAGDEQVSATETDYQFRALVTETIGRLSVSVRTNNLNGTTTYTIRKNTADTAITCSVGSSTTGRFEDTVNTDTISSTTDLVNMKVVTAGSSGSSNLCGMTILWGANGGAPTGQPTMRRWGGSIWPTGARRIGRGW